MTLGSETSSKAATVASATVRALPRLAWASFRPSYPSLSNSSVLWSSPAPTAKAATCTAPAAASVFKAEPQQGCHLLGKVWFPTSSASEPFSRHLTPLQTPT